ncbi:MAG TPA: hypothetical protein VNC78_12240 [Actinomycetota bacterium]|nr:hypothetical protein [Actinomycetota bacterium]
MLIRLRSGDSESRASAKDGVDLVQCPNCKADDCTQIVINLQEEESVQFFSCRRCEWKWWEHEGDTINLDEVLDLAAKRR